MIGFFNVIKPTGVSSGYVVNKLKHILGEKVGHLGTLDPLASGVLPVAVNKATRLFDYFLNKDKVYFALMKFGVLTDTLDSEGKVIKRVEKEITLDEVKRAASELVGERYQIPPKFSAKQIDGKRAYFLMQNGDTDFKLEPRKVQIYSINVEKWHQNGVFALKIHCSAGTYVRSIVRDIAEKLDSVATTVAIIRLKSGAFEIDDAVTIEEIENDKEKYLIKINDVLKLKEIKLTKDEARALQDGKNISIKKEDGEYMAFYETNEFAILSVSNNFAKIKTYFYNGEIV